MIRHREDPLSRRRFLDRVAAGLAAVAALPLLEACSGEEVPPGIRVALAELPDGARLIVLDGNLPVEVTRESGEVRARSLICTHQGCQVQWKTDEQHYHCPCHDGVFDRDGKPILGPPREGLREFAVTTDQDYVYVDTRTPAGDG